MAKPTKNHRNLAVIGAGVGVAAASVITLLVLRDKPDEDRRRELADSVTAPDSSGRAVEGGVVKPWETKQLTPAEVKELATAEAAEKAARDHEERTADDQLAKAARADALEQARNAGVLGRAAIGQGGAFASLTGTGDISSGFDDADIYGGLIGNDPKDPSFGYGKSGFGPGGGGTGWGTIGTGRYGSIGHGSGTNSGYGVGGGRGGMRGRTSSPTVSIGQPNATGDLDKAIIRRYIKRNIQKIQYCYEKELLNKPQLQGTITVKFTITPTGLVDNAGATGVDPTTSSCIATVIKGIEFPKPKGGGSVSVTYPFMFKPAGSP